MTLTEIIQDYVLNNIDSLSSPSLTPGEGLPDADTFFGILSAQAPDYIGFADGEYTYYDVSVFWWMAFGSLYLAIPEYDIYERHDGKWATPETAKEAARELQHEFWDDEDSEFRNKDKY